MKVTKFTFILSLFLFSCSARPGNSDVEYDQPHTPPKIELPEIDGNPISDLPIADPQLKEVWVEGRALLDQIPPQLDSAAGAKISANWLREFEEWSRSFFAKRHALIKKLSAMQSNERIQLFSSLLFANIDIRFIRDLESIEVPSRLSKRSREYIHAKINLKISMLLEATISEYQASLDGLNNAHPTLLPWQSIAESELEKLAPKRSFYQRETFQKKTRYKERIGEDWITECQTRGVPTYEKYPGRANNTSKKQHLALILSEDDFKDLLIDEGHLQEFRKALLKSSSKLAKNVKVVSLKEIDKAKALVDKKKLSNDSPVCAAAPPLEAVLQERYENLVIAKVSKSKISGLCTTWDSKTKKTIRKRDCEEDEVYELSLMLQAYGPKKNFDPAHRQARVSIEDYKLPGAWIEAAKRMKPRNLGGILGNLVAGWGTVMIERRFYDKGYQNPWFEKTHQLKNALNKSSCNLSVNPLSYDLSWTISPTGQSKEAILTWVTKPTEKADEMKACLEKVVEEIPWRCPTRGKDTKLSSRVCEKKSYQWWD